ncbi:MFS transporter [Sulfurimonas sp.]|jgi:MFS family permease|uniref:MFS transporter n=1 Tax=Sulfurimonas sp. TaxID=2022749 RepID=UPI0025EEEB9D|nr:MFS transporter [Sulfurimonas sp.]MCK9474128.1 MFS transporter [Sulfurimonas sp.]
MQTKNTFSIVPISSLFIAIGFLAIGYGMILTFIGVYLKEMGSSNITIGLINATFFLGAIGASIFSQKIIATVGHIRSFATFASIMIIGFLGHSLYFNEVFWAILRLLSGFAYYGLLIILESWLNEKSSKTHRSKILAIYTIIFYLATAIGQLLLNIGDTSGHVFFIIGSILVLFSIIFISMTKIKEPILEPFERYSLPKIFSIAPLALASSFIGGFFVGGFFTMMPVFIVENFDSIHIVSLFMTITIIGALLSQWPIGIFSDKLGRRKMIAFSSFFIAFISACFLLSSYDKYYFYLLGALLGVGIFSLYPLAMARANDVVDENKNILEISRTLLFAYGLGSFAAPLFIGVGSYFFENFIFFSFFILSLFLGFYALSKEKIPDKDMSIFVNMPSVSGAISPNLDPRQDGA